MRMVKFFVSVFILGIFSGKIYSQSGSNNLNFSYLSLLPDTISMSNKELPTAWLKVKNNDTSTVEFNSPPEINLIQYYVKPKGKKILVCKTRPLYSPSIIQNIGKAIHIWPKDSLIFHQQYPPICILSKAGEYKIRYGFKVYLRNKRYLLYTPWRKVYLKE